MNLTQAFRSKKVLVTGNTGFKGAWLTSWLVKLGAQVYGLSNGIPTVPSFFELASHREKIQYLEADIRDLAGIIERIKKIEPDYIFHLAAQPIVRHAYESSHFNNREQHYGYSEYIGSIEEARSFLYCGVDYE